MNGEKISLCCITGNCEGIIGSFIDRFSPVADEICIVRACGSLIPDRSLDIAREKGCRTGEYFNPTKPDWPHVENYGDARNVAWQMATHEWIMWADIDDEISEASIKEIRRMVKETPGDIALIQCPYDVPDQHIHDNVRERLARRGKFKWDMPVHECLLPIGNEKLNSVVTRRAKISHANKEDRTPSCERNLRILENIPPDQRGSGTYFYMFSELLGVGRKKDAVDAATKFLAAKDAGENEKYEILLQLAQISDDPSQMEALLHEAVKCSPDRCEALYELTNLALTFGNVDRARAYCRQMRSLPKPNRQMWNARQRFYGWCGEQLEDQVLRCDGHGPLAEAREFNRWKAAGGKISLLHATRGRTLQATKARSVWLENASDPNAIEHIFAIDADDEHSQPLRRFKNVIVSGEGGCVEAWNVAAHISHGDVLIQLSDDWIPVKNWDQIILERLGDLSQSKVLAISDGSRRDNLLCMAICTRAHYKRQGYLFHPDFKGVYSDNWFTRQAYGDSVVIEAKDIIFNHLHPAFGSGEMDETYAKQNSKERYVEGERIYRQLEKAEGKIINTTCCVRLGDNLTHLQFLRKLAQRYPRTQFYHSAGSAYLPQLRDVVADLPNILLGNEIAPDSIEVWKNHEGFFQNHSLKNDFASVYVAWFDELARRIGLENPIKKPGHFLFNYPALIRKTPLDKPFDFLVINSAPLSGQWSHYSDLSNTVQRLKNEFGYSVITTSHVPDAECTQNYGLTVTDIGALSRYCRYIIMASTGPSWTTFNIYNLNTVLLRIILIDNERINIAPNTVHVQTEEQIWEVLKHQKLI